MSATVIVASGQVPTQWTTIDPSGIASFNDVAYGDGKFVLAGNQGSNDGPTSVVYSSDDGATWSSPIDVGTGAKQAAMSQVHRFHDRWVIARGNEVWSSTNLTTWTQETVTGVTVIRGSSGTYALTEIFDGTTYRGVYVTSTSYAVVESSPGNWVAASGMGFFPIGGSLTYTGGALFFVSRTASGPNIYKSTDMGNSWTSAAINVATNMTGKKLFDISKIGSALWVTGTTGFIAKSTDGGSTWVEKNAPNASLADMWEMDGNSEVLIAMGNGGGSTRALYSNDEGETWQAIPDGSGNFARAAWVSVAASLTGMVGTSSSSRLMVGVLPTTPSTTTSTTTVPTTTVPTTTAPTTTVPTTTAPTTTTSSSTAVVGSSTTTAAGASQSTTSATATVMLRSNGQFAHAPVDKCQYVSQVGRIAAADVQVDLVEKSVSCGDKADLEIDLRGNESKASAIVDGKLVFFSGKLGIATGTGFKPGSTAEIWMASDPTYLGSTEVKSDGTWEKTFRVPANIASGTHTIQAEGLTPSNAPKAVNAGVRIAKPSELPATGGNSSKYLAYGFVLVAAGVALAAGRRRLY